MLNTRLMQLATVIPFYAPEKLERWQQFDRGGKYRLAREERAKARRRKARK